MKALQIVIVSLLLSTTLFGQDYSRALVTTIGEGLVYAVPDEVLLRLSIDITAAEIFKAKAENDKVSKETIQYLKSKGIEERHIQTQYMSVSKLYKSQRVSQDEIHHYRASQTINVCIKKVNEYSEIVEGLLLLGVNTVGNPQFRTTELEKHQTEAKRQAIISAKKKAIILTSSLGQTIGTAFQIEEIIGANRRSNQGAYTDAGNSGNDFGRDTSFAPGQLLIRAEVKVSFNLRNE